MNAMRLRADLTPYALTMFIGYNPSEERQEKAKHCVRLAAEAIGAGMLVKEGGQIVKNAEIR